MNLICNNESITIGSNCIKEQNGLQKKYYLKLIITYLNNYVLFHKFIETLYPGIGDK